RLPRVRPVIIEEFPHEDQSMRKADDLFIDKAQVVVSTQAFVSCNELRVTVGTNCPQGGDSGHGGRTVLILENPNGEISGAPLTVPRLRTHRRSRSWPAATLNSKPCSRAWSSRSRRYACWCGPT